MIPAKYLRLFLGAMWVGMIVPQDSLGQSFLRTDTLVSPVRVDIDLLASVDVNNDLTVQPPGLVSSHSNSGEVFAADGGSNTAMDEHGLANATAGGTAMSIIPQGSTTFAPTVDTSFSVLLSANADDGHDAFAFLGNEDLEGSSGSLARSTFQVQGEEDQYQLHGFLQLVAVGTVVGDADLANSGGMVSENTVHASIGSWFVDAEYVGDGDWHVTGVLPGLTIDEMTTGVNNTYIFSVVVNKDTELDFISNISMDDGAYAGGIDHFVDGNGINASLNYGFSASAWAVATPLGEMPLPGDVDGDGDVDADDFVIIIGGQGEDFGATLTDGDANVDREVNDDDVQLALDNTFLAGIPGDFDDDNDIDGADFLKWQRGFGTTSPNADISDGDADGDADVDATDLGYWQQNFGYALPPASLSAVDAVPEPSSYALLLGMVVLTGMKIRSRLV